MAKKSRANYEFCQIAETKNKGIRIGDEHILEGEVVSVGEQVFDISKGDKVIFYKEGSFTYPINAKSYWFVNYKNILYIL